MHSEIDLEMSHRTIFSTNLVSLAPITYKKTPHMTYIWVFQVTSILTSIYELRHLKFDLQRPLISLLTTNSDSLVSITYKKTPHMTYIWVFQVPSILTSIYEVRHLIIDLQRSGISFLTTNALTKQEIEHCIFWPRIWPRLWLFLNGGQYNQSKIHS